MSIPVLLIIINLLSAFDGIISWYGLTNKILIEINPVALFFISKLGIAGGIIAVKIAVPVSSIILFWHKDRYFDNNPVLFALYLIAGFYFFVVCYLAFGLLDWAINH